MGRSTLDLYASKLCHQLRRYIAWRSDLGSIAADAFLHPWDREYGSSIQFCRLGSKKDPRRKERSSDHSDYHIANSALACRISENTCTVTISYATLNEYINRSKPRRESNHEKQLLLSSIIPHNSRSGTRSG